MTLLQGVWKTKTDALCLPVCVLASVILCDRRDSSKQDDVGINGN